MPNDEIWTHIRTNKASFSANGKGVYTGLEFISEGREKIV